ncbi:tyrosine-type recombinase/integrase [Bacillus cereus]
MKTEDTPFEPLTEDEMSRLFGVLDLKQFPQFRDFVIMNLLYDSGMRINEVIGLAVSEIDIKTETNRFTS